MTLIVHQAVYGDVNGAHGLLAASSTDQTLFRALTVRTDRPGNPPSNVRWEPYISGFPIEHHYVVAKTFPDADASRAGMVQTHALVVDLTDAVQLTQLAPLLQLLLDAPSWHANLTPSVISTGEDATTAATADVPGLGSVVHAMLENDTPGKPVVWIGQDGFIEIVQRIWMHLWPAARERLSFRLSFGPQDAEGQRLTLVATPKELASRWASFAAVQRTDQHEVCDQAEAFLLGLPQGAPLRDFLSDLNASLPAISDLKVAERCYEFLHRSPSPASADEVRSIARMLGKLSPAPEHGTRIKQRVLRQLADLTAHGNPTDIMALRNFDTTPFPDGAAALQAALTSWLASALQSSSGMPTDEIAGVLMLACDEPHRFLSTALREATRVAIIRWTSVTGASLWRLWQSAPVLIERLDPAIPLSNQVERDLVAWCPTRLTLLVGEQVAAFALRRRWYVLHAVALSAYEDPDVALRQQLAVDRDVGHLSALRALASRVPTSAILETALDTGDERMLRLLGEACAGNPDILQSLDVTEERWRRIWLYAIEGGTPPLAGINRPMETVHALLDLRLDGIRVDGVLLGHLARTVCGDLTGYARRRNIWSTLEPSLAKAFLATTARGWLERFATDPTYDPDVEHPLENAILDDACVAAYLRPSRARPLSAAINLFDRFSRLTQQQFRTWLDSALNSTSAIGSADATRIGRLIMKRHWDGGARLLARLIREGRRDDLLPALVECQQLLGIFDRLSLIFAGKFQDSGRTPDEWWQALLEIAVELYPSGPSESDIWSRAGGDPSAIETVRTGRSTWDAALRRLRHGGGGDGINPQSLLRAMQLDYPNNEQLRFLQDSSG